MSEFGQGAHNRQQPLLKLCREGAGERNDLGFDAAEGARQELQLLLLRAVVSQLNVCEHFVELADFDHGVKPAEVHDDAIEQVVSLPTPCQVVQQLTHFPMVDKKDVRLQWITLEDPGLVRGLPVKGSLLNEVSLLLQQAVLEYFRGDGRGMREKVLIHQSIKKILIFSITDDYRVTCSYKKYSKIPCTFYPVFLDDVLQNYSITTIGE